MEPYFILYVADQQRSASFYSHVLDITPRLNVPGMTEFNLSSGSVLGLMPESGIKALLGLPDPALASGAPRCELYLLVPHPEHFLSRALRSGARELSSLQRRDWGHDAAYCLDLDGHVLAFARPAQAA